MPMPVAWALQGPPGAPRPPLPPSGSRRSDRRDLDGGRGGRNPRGGAASCAAAEDSMGPRYTGGTPPVVPVRPRLYRRGRNPHWSTAGLSAVLPRSSALAVKDRQGQNDHLSLFFDVFLPRDEPASWIRPPGALVRIREVGFLGGDFYLRT
ncbi:hypothetical protein NDU88_001443 [Pleurodeles waltl]|uniref:Uncharacterized protein n=1 Tax=Pleurodeles waltl TaxID=8319 RepID=A0AAV7SZJ5_PLEWA|nr:hypothetical protein NDU88_001443 [Pleurodeles waltl]